MADSKPKIRLPSGTVQHADLCASSGETDKVLNLDSGPILFVTGATPSSSTDITPSSQLFMLVDGKPLPN